MDDKLKNYQELLDALNNESQDLYTYEPKTMEEVNDILERPNVPKEERGIDHYADGGIEKDKNIEESDTKEDDFITKKDLQSAKRKDVLFSAIEDLNKSLAHMSAANPNYIVEPVTTKTKSPDFYKDLLGQYQMQQTQKEKTEDRKYKRMQQEALNKYRQSKLGLSERQQEAMEQYRQGKLDLSERKLETKGSVNKFISGQPFKVGSQIVQYNPEKEEFKKLYGARDEREKRLREKFDWRKKEQDELSNKQVESITQLNKGLHVLDEIKEMYPKSKEDLGFYASRLEESKKYIPYQERNPDFVKMQQLVGIELADYVKSISGAQVSEEEAQRLLKNIPNMTDKPKEFETKLKTFEDLLGSYIDKTIEDIEKQGKDPSGFKKDREPQSQNKEEKITVQLPSGKIGRIDKDKLEKFMKKYPNAKVME